MSGAPDTPLDLLVVGSGVAGLSAAVRAAEAHGMRVGVLTKGELDQATTRWAQGGVAAVLGDDPDSTDLHLADTLAAGAGLCDPDAVKVLVDEGPGRVHELIALGAIFDRDAQGELLLTREGGHSHPRVVHAGGAATGVEVERALVVAVQETVAAVYDHWLALDLLVERGRCVGVTARGPGGDAVAVRARHVLMATGGAGQLYAVTTNPPEATGDGIAMALRAGVAVADLEFVQFHPTALHHPAMPRPLLSEALRGHGALLRDADGRRFVDEMLPRDRVSRAIMATIARQELDHVWLDATGLERFGERFPTIAASLATVGLDPRRDWLPVAPAAHYLCGGIVADLDGATSLPGLWVAGEAACNGVHGANRLASNSLLDGMVFGPRIVEAVERGKDGPSATGAMRCVLKPADATTAEQAIPGRAIARRAAPRRHVAQAPGDEAAAGRSPASTSDTSASGGAAEPTDVATWRPSAMETGPVDAGVEVVDVAKARASLQATMSADAGVLRSAVSLERALDAVGRTLAAVDALGVPVGANVAHAVGVPVGADAKTVADAAGARREAGPAAPALGAARPAVELANLATVARALCTSAQVRTESRGAHARSDYPDLDPQQRVRYVIGGLTGQL